MASNELSVIREESLITNPSARVAVCLVLDCSGSMGEVVAGETRDLGQVIHKDNQQWRVVEGGITKMQLLNQGLAHFFSELRADPIANDSAEVGIVGFSDTPSIVLDISPLTDEVCAVRLTETGGLTSLGRGVRAALDLLDARKEDYKDKGVDYYQPWLIIMTDGAATDDSHIAVADEINRRVTAKKLNVVPVGIGDAADKNALAMLSPGRTPLKLRGLKFADFFKWLSQSLASVSRSIPGERVQIDDTQVKGWGEAF